MNGKSVLLRAYSHQSKVEAKTKKITQQAKQIKEQESILVGYVPPAFVFPRGRVYTPVAQ